MNLEDVKQYKSLDLLARSVVEGFITGLHKSPFHGFSVEFAEHRQYNLGESTKNIDWRLFAKTDKLYTKRYDEETNLRCHIVLDTSSSMYFPEGSNSKIHFGTVAAAAILYLLKKQRDAFGLTLFDEAIYYKSEVKSSQSHYMHLLGELDKVKKEPTKEKSTRVIETLHHIAHQIHRRSLVVLFTDMFEPTANLDELVDALQHLKFNKHEVILFHTMDADKEMEFEYTNRPYKFVDKETNEMIKLYPDEIRESYKEQMHDFYSELKNRCGMYQIDFVQADINKDFHQILLPFFLKRQKMN